MSRATGPMASTPHLRLDFRDEVAVVTLSRPPVNAFTLAMYDELTGLLSRLVARPETQVIVLTGEGRVFSAGEELAERRDLSAAGRRDRITRAVESMAVMAELDLPVVCAINGSAAGGGLCLAAVSDYRVAASDALFTLPEIQVGAVGAGGAFQRMLRMPEGAIRLMLYTAGRFSAEQALKWHLVDEVVPPESVLPRALEVANAIARQPRQMLMLAKRAVLAAAVEVDWQRATYATVEHSLAAGELPRD